MLVYQRVSGYNMIEATKMLICEIKMVISAVRNGDYQKWWLTCNFQQPCWQNWVYWYMMQKNRSEIWSHQGWFFSPPARWGLLDFIRAVLLLLLRLRILLLRLLLAVQIPVGTAGPPPRAPDPSGHCRTSTASCRSQWALPDLNRDFQVAVCTAGPQPRLPDRSGHCWTSTASSRSQWALPGLNRDFQIAVGTAGPQPRLPDRSGHCRTSTGRKDVR